MSLLREMYTLNTEHLKQIRELIKKLITSMLPMKEFIDLLTKFTHKKYIQYMNLTDLKISLTY
jgi:hypothetical protein